MMLAVFLFFFVYSKIIKLGYATTGGPFKVQLLRFAQSAYALLSTVETIFFSGQLLLCLLPALERCKHSVQFIKQVTSKPMSALTFGFLGFFWPFN